jgi:Tfp pilus assembly protein FimT
MRRAVASLWNEEFTKWDLLIVIAVLGVLAALLSPVLRLALPE